MTTAAPPATAPVSVAELKAYLRLDGTDEDAMLAGLARTATALCEAFTGLLLIRRSVREERLARRAGALTWRPVVAVTGVESLDDGASRALSSDQLSITFEDDGGARVALVGTGVERIRIEYRAGLADDWNDVPEPLRQGITRLVAHLYTQRDAATEPAPPAAVAALWRPWRRLRLR